MDTIIYLKMQKRQRMQELPVFHISMLREEELAAAFYIPATTQSAAWHDTLAKARLPEAQKRVWGTIWEGMQILYVTIPWDIDSLYACWPMELSRWLVPFFGYSASVETVCDFSVERWLKEKGSRERWEDVWPYPAYQEYRRKAYADILLYKGMGRLTGPLFHFYVIGYEDFVPQVLAPYIRRMKSLTFIIAGKPREQMEDYLEELCDEEGLAAHLRVLEDGTGYRRLRLECGFQALVLDLTGEEKVAPAGRSKGMVWIDMSSQEAKRRKIMAISGETAYFSMKEEWGSLDTVSKNGYNT